MPMDIIHEILLYLPPQELLMLARVSKSFHNYLYKKSSVTYWQRVLKQIEGAPPRPKELIEPAWVALIASPLCTSCGKMNAAQVYWAFLMRICESCKPKLLIDQFTLLDSERIGAIPRTILNLGRVTRFGRAYCLRSEAKEAIRNWLQLSKSEDEEALNKYIDDEAERIKGLSEFQYSCIAWLESEEAKRKDYRVQLEKERFEAIAVRLQELGWEPELQMLVQNRNPILSRHALVQGVEPLTDHAWRSMRDELVKLMQDLREKRLARERKQRMEGRWSSYMSAAPYLLKQQLEAQPELRSYGFNLADLALTPEVRELIHADADVYVGSQGFMALQPHMDAIVEGWKSRVCEELRKQMRASPKTRSGKAQPRKGPEPNVELATTMFSCGGCTLPCLFFPNVLAHSCQRPSNAPAQQDAYGEFVHAKNDTKLRTTLNLPAIGYALSIQLRKLELSKQAYQIVQFCDKDPETTTAKEMDELDVRLVQGKAIMNWRAAIIEQIQHKHQMATWRRADADELAGAKKAERKFVETRGGWTCHKCPTPSSFGGFQWLFIARHLEKAHDIKEPSVENGDMSVALNPGDVYAAGIYKMTLPGYEMLHLSKKGSWSTQRAETYNHII
ncbi:uncharacterized protein C8Q71DRAFT_861184 [Rhodofomes roseus]|uniref:F-box domain-containing protein n=1 Tax=Rhodofomes roseus TaxID=34475 RepID=A0ABQ8K5M9_9APHY|nr:uncharacterized protein C8Q71DRAFT_861184 [Rhodofomes roseus]KAH9832290.1 hypothetical protein C8Q71DRAFT_861184 [Rhodofomes roseus]